MNCRSALSSLFSLLLSALKPKSARHTHTHTHKRHGTCKTLQTHSPLLPQLVRLVAAAGPRFSVREKDLRIYLAFFILCHTKHARRFKQISKKEYNLYKIQRQPIAAEEAEGEAEADTEVKPNWNPKSLRQVELVRNILAAAAAAFFLADSRFACVDMTKAQICIYLHVIGWQQEGVGRGTDRERDRQRDRQQDVSQ